MIAVIRDTGIAPTRVELEITEGVLMRDTDETLAILQRLRNFGTRLAMDDFGTGYSSLGYLSKFRFDKIKIDRCFTARLGEDANAVAIVRAVVGLTRALGGVAIAEGVETSAQAALLRVEGCAEGQGYLFGRPIPGDAFDAFLRSGLTLQSGSRPIHVELVTASAA
jgi:EAL domain-containing protein (putative c-di-GMP-specific phosphodiesterase class I)